MGESLRKPTSSRKQFNSPDSIYSLVYDLLYKTDTEPEINFTGSSINWTTECNEKGKMQLKRD